MNIEAEAEVVHEMERQMRINEDILRYMTLRVDELEEGPSAMMRSRDRDDRPRRGRDDRGPRGDRGGPPRGDDAPAKADDAPAEDAKSEGDDQ